MSKVLDRLRLKDRTKRVLISGFDGYTRPSGGSIRGASWIFGQEQLRDSGAFLALTMNGERLTPDHGAPVRLVVPGWYGCACIKWVNEISAVDEGAEATAQMRDYAARTHQDGVPRLAQDYKPPIIEPAAMPIRVEKWRVNGHTCYQVVGLLWGQAQTAIPLEIKFSPDAGYSRVERLEGAGGSSWRFWTHSWVPQRCGIHEIRLRVADPRVRTLRLDAGYYARRVEIADIGIP